MGDFDYSKEQKISLPCNLCTGTKFSTISRKDKYGFYVTTELCRACGFIFINPRMTNEGYERFYQDEYRKIIFKKNISNKTNLDSLFLKSQEFGIVLGNKLKKYLNSGLTIEVGSSTGGVLSGLFKSVGNLDILGIEPSLKEAHYAIDKGIRTEIAMFESFRFDESQKANNIVIIKSLNHLLDASLFFEWCFKHLKKEGKLVVVVLDFLSLCLNKGKILTQVDHPFMFTENSLKAFASNSGFLSEYLENDGKYIYAVFKKFVTSTRPLKKRRFFDRYRYLVLKIRLSFFGFIYHRIARKLAFLWRK